MATKKTSKTASKKTSHRPPAKKKSTDQAVPYVEYGGASKKGAKKPVAYVEFTDSTSTKKGSKKPVPNVEFPPKKKKK